MLSEGFNTFLKIIFLTDGRILCYRSKLKRHAVDRHFKEDIAKELSNKRPFRCPLKTCKFEADAFGPLLRHYGPSHAVEKFMVRILSMSNSCHLSVNI